MISRFKWWLWRKFRSAETRYHELNYLFWECTTRCNLACRHCGSDCKIAGRNTDMPLEVFMKAIDTIPRKVIPREFTVVLTGGEPLLRPDIEQIGRAIRRRGMGWSMVSNGYYYDRQMHARLMGAGMGALTISLDGLEAEHEWMRGGKGCYARTVEAIRIAAAEKRINFDVVTCVHKRNLAQLEQIHDLLAGMGVKQWRLFTIIPIGRAAKDPDMQLSGAEFRQLMEFIKGKRAVAKTGQGGRKGAQREVWNEVRQEARREVWNEVQQEAWQEAPKEAVAGTNPAQMPRLMKVTFSCEGYLGRYEGEVRDVPFFCHAGVNIASVLIDGRICACPNIDRDAFSQGNIYTDNLYDVWLHRFQPFRDRSWARKGECADCPVFKNCQGNGMHNWHGAQDNVLTCHYKRTL